MELFPEAEYDIKFTVPIIKLSDFNAEFWALRFSRNNTNTIHNFLLAASRLLISVWEKNKEILHIYMYISNGRESEFK